MPSHPLPTQQGPFRADQLREGDPYELSNGHPIYCAPSGREHAGPNLTGAAALESDPDVEWAGVDAGYAPDEGTLRAPDVSIGPPGNETGWIRGVPPLAVEYAGVGQDEAELRTKVAELLSKGTQQIWVVRLVGPRRVEVHQAAGPVRVVGYGETLTASGILRNPVPVAALFDREAAHEVILKNLLQRKGYRDLEQVREDSRAEGQVEGKAEGKAEGEVTALREALLIVLEQRALTLTAEQDVTIRDCADPDQLRSWLRVSLVASSAAEVIATSRG